MTHCYLRAMSPIHIKCNTHSPEYYEMLIIARSRQHGSASVDVDRKLPTPSLQGYSCPHILRMQSIMAFGTLWGLVTCHSYGGHGMRVSFPVRQMLRLLSQSISRNIERLSYAKRLHTRKLVCKLSFTLHILRSTR